jgi:hypothetical protein
MAASTGMDDPNETNMKNAVCPFTYTSELAPKRTGYILIR